MLFHIGLAPLHPICIVKFSIHLSCEQTSMGVLLHCHQREGVTVCWWTSCFLWKRLRLQSLVYPGRTGGKTPSLNPGLAQDILMSDVAYQIQPPDVPALLVCSPIFWFSTHFLFLPSPFSNPGRRRRRRSIGDNQMHQVCHPLSHQSLAWGNYLNWSHWWAIPAQTNDNSHHSLEVFFVHLSVSTAPLSV